MPTLTPAQEEAYAHVRPSDAWAFAVILEHAMFPSTLRFIDGTGVDVSLPPGQGQPSVLFVATNFTFRPPAQATKEGPGEGSLRIDGVSAEVYDAARWAGVDGNPVRVTILDYQIPLVGGAPNFAAVTAPVQIYSGLRVDRVPYTATSITVPLSVRDWGAVNFPRQTFSRELYASLHG